jgi:RNA polymerase sigma factor (sigma-70 family)
MTTAVTEALVGARDANAPSDEAILARMRSGDDGAYVLLYERYVGAARRLARSILHSRNDVDDVVSEVFAGTFAAIRRGRGPRDAFGPYLLSSVRRECYRSWRRRGRRELPSEHDDVERASALPLPPADPTEKAVLEEAFAALPANLRTVLWLTEVEGLSHSEVAMRTATTGQAVAAMAVRARRALAESYLNAHGGASEGPLGRDCRTARRAMARVVRGTASDRQRRQVDGHLAVCGSCAQAHDQLRVVNRRLRELAPPTLVGTLGVTRVLGGALLRGNLTSWLAGPGATAAAVTTAVAAAVVLPGAVDVGSPATAIAPPAVVAPAPPDPVPSARSSAPDPRPNRAVTVVEETARALIADPSAEVLGIAFAVSTGDVPTPSAAGAPPDTTLAPVPPSPTPLPAAAAETAVATRVSTPSPAVPTDAELELPDVPPAPELPAGPALPEVGALSVGGDDVGLSAEVNADGVDLDVHVDPPRLPNVPLDAGVDVDVDVGVGPGAPLDVELDLGVELDLSVELPDVEDAPAVIDGLVGGGPPIGSRGLLGGG